MQPYELLMELEMKFKNKRQIDYRNCDTCLCHGCFYNHKEELNCCYDCETCEDFDHHTEACDLFEPQENE